AEQKPAEEKPAEQQAEQKPAEEKPAEQQAEQKPAEEKPAEQQAEQKPAEEKPAENAKVWKTVEIQPQTLKINVDASGVVWSKKMKTFTLQPKAWETFRVEYAIPHGTKVKKGDLLIKFKNDVYQRELQLRILDSELAEIANKKALLQRKVADITFEITNKLVMRKKEDREFRYSHNKKYDPDITRSSTALKLERAIQNYRNQKAELDQLSKMYEADDLCDATEEIVLQRQKIVVQGAEHDMNLAKAQNVWSHKMILPRFEEELDDEYRKDMAAIEAEVAGLEMTRRSIELERKKVDHLHLAAIQKFKDFQEDGKLFEIRAEEDGMLLYGYFENGDWMNCTKNVSLLQPGKTVAAGTPLFTLVDPSALYVELDIAENLFSKTAADQKGYFVVNTYPEVEIPLTVTEVDPFIIGPKRRGKANIEVPQNMNIHPGIRGKVVLAAIRKTDAIMVPETALERDDEMKRFVYVTDAEGKNPTRRYVKTGFKQDSKVEIREGLEVGTKVVETAAEVE
ncbi:MAG: HlyD family efflux transporter periplasmic adaptor subunit, partial [Thermoguttaceae bacterium]|nr:HlyD family efflux transporter periplasmic adaptor subunit [Thermoguttaceae bacterium]